MSRLRLSIFVSIFVSIVVAIAAFGTVIFNRANPLDGSSAASALAAQPESPLLQATNTVPPTQTLAPTPMPLGWPTPLPFEDSLLANNYSPDVEGFPDVWVRVTNPYGGYSLEIPEGWDASLRTDGGTAITPAERANVDRIYAEYLLFEKTNETDLIEWLEQWAPIENQRIMTGQARTFEAIEFESDGPNASQKAYEHGDNSLVGQAYVLTNGRMLLRMQTNGMSDVQDAILRRMAESLVFHEKAPSTILQVYGLGGVVQGRDQPGYLASAVTLEDYLRVRRVRPLAINAIEARLETGVTPSELLQDPEVAEAYNELLAGYTLRIAQADNARAEASQSPLTTPTASPSPSATIYHTSTPTWTPTPTSTPFPPSALDDLATKHSGLTPFVIECPYNIKDCLVVVWYDDALWQEMDNPHYTNSLHHRTLTECSMAYSLPRGGGRQISEQTLAGAHWPVYSVGSGGVVYSGALDSVPIIVGLGLPNRVDYREENKGQCQVDIESVVDTMSVVRLKEPAQQ